MTVPYYRRADGLRFECTRCGACCTRPGPVFFPRPELEAAAAFLGLTPKAFKRQYSVHPIQGVPAIDPGDDQVCPFFDEDSGCRIYDARPTQCSTFPFWPETVRRQRSWERAGADCEGIGQGPRHAPQSIERHLTACEDAGLPEDEPW